MFRKFFSIIGIDKSVLYGLLGRSWGIISVPISILLILKYMNPETQGVYYTMMSLIGIQVIFEMGLSTVLSNFFFQEFTKVHINHFGRIVGCLNSRNRILGVYEKSIKWFRYIGVVFFFLSLPIGYWVLNKASLEINDWLGGWILIVVSITLNFFITPLISLEIGSGGLKNIYKIEAFSSVLSAIFLWVLIINDLGIYGIFLGIFFRFFIFLNFFFSKRKFLFFQLFKFHEKFNLFINWRKEIWPMQWRISISWMAGYFIFNSFTPIVLYFRGPVEAGKIGLAVSLVSAITTLTLIWINAISPRMGGYVSERKFEDLNSIFMKYFIISILFSLFCVIILLVIIYYINNNSDFGSRFLEYKYLIVFFVSAIAQIIMSLFAAYFRVFKKEPLFYVSIMQAILLSIFTIFFSYKFDANHVVLGVFLVNYIFVLPASFVIFMRFKKSYSVGKSESRGFYE